MFWWKTGLFRGGAQLQYCLHVINYFITKVMLFSFLFLVHQTVTTSAFWTAWPLELLTKNTTHRLFENLTFMKFHNCFYLHNNQSSVAKLHYSWNLLLQWYIFSPVWVFMWSEQLWLILKSFPACVTLSSEPKGYEKTIPSPATTCSPCCHLAKDTEVSAVAPPDHRGASFLRLWNFLTHPPLSTIKKYIFHDLGDCFKKILLLTEM